MLRLQGPELLDEELHGVLGVQLRGRGLRLRIVLWGAGAYGLLLGGASSAGVLRKVVYMATYIYPARAPLGVHAWWCEM